MNSHRIADHICLLPSIYYAGAIVKDVSIWVLDKKKLIEANKQ